MERIKEIMKNPAAALKKAKKEKDMGKTITLLLISWIFIAIGVMILPTALGGTLAVAGIAAGIAVFFTGLICTLVFGYLLKIGMNILGGKGGFYHGLTVMTYSIMPFSIGVLASAVIALIPIISIPIVFLVIAATSVMSAAILYRGTKDMFGTDMITTLVGISVFMLGIILAVYMALILGFLGAMPMLETAGMTMPAA